MSTFDQMIRRAIRNGYQPSQFQQTLWREAEQRNKRLRQRVEALNGKPKTTARNEYARAYTDGVLSTARMVALAERKRAMREET